jgi:hypothetical protein
MKRHATASPSPAPEKRRRPPAEDSSATIVDISLDVQILVDVDFGVTLPPAAEQDDEQREYATAISRLKCNMERLDVYMIANRQYSHMWAEQLHRMRTELIHVSKEVLSTLYNEHEKDLVVKLCKTPFGGDLLMF